MKCEKCGYDNKNVAQLESTQNKIINTLWKKISKLSEGTENGKINVIKLIFANFNNLLLKCLSILELLAKQENLKKIRITITSLLLKKPVSEPTHQNLLQILVHDKNIKKIVDKIIIQRIKTFTSTNLRLISSTSNPKLSANTGKTGLLEIASKLFANIKKTGLLEITSKLFVNIRKIRVGTVLQKLQKLKELITKNQLKPEVQISQAIEREMITHDSFDKIYNLLVEFGKKKGWVK